MAERIHGPYPHRNRWRVVGVRADGTRIRETFDDLPTAKAWADQARAALGHRTVEIAVSEYLAHLVERGRRASTVTTARYRLLAFFRVAEDGDRLLATLSPALALRLYSSRCNEVKPDTHRGELALASAWATWCVRRGYLAENPFTLVEAIGARSAGKDQLRLDEARRFLGFALRDESPGATAAALALLTGARASEVVDRVVRDLDDGGRLLWIPHAKTVAGVRQIPVPECLRPRVLSLAEGKPPTARLWGEVTRHWLGHHVRRLCAVAGVPVVSPHGLRGLNATLRVQAGEAVEQVAKLLGQAGPAVTRRHYLAPGAESAVLAAALTDRLTEDV